MRQKLFTKEIDNKLFAQYKYGSDLSKQMVVAKIFNPFNKGCWYIINSDPNDPDYLWAIVDLFEIEAGSVSREDLQTIKVPPFGLNLERDLYFQPINAQELYDRLRQGERFEHGGSIDVIQNDKDESYLTSVNAKPTDAAIKLAKGGTTKSYTYVPKSDIKEIDAVIGGKEQKISGKDVLDGAYVKKSVPKVDKEGNYKVQVNQYIPYKSNKGVNYYYVSDSKFNTINKNTGKIYRGKEMNNYKFSTENEAQRFADKLNNEGENKSVPKSNKVEKKSAIKDNELGTFKDARYAKGKVLYIPPTREKGAWKGRQERLAEAKGISGKYTHREKGYIMSKTQAEKLKKYILEGYDAGSMTGELVKPKDLYKKGGVTFKEKVKAISNSLKGKKVPSKLKKDYGATYDKKESVLAATRIAGAMKAKMESKKKN